LRIKKKETPDVVDLIASIHKNSKVKLEEWILLKKEYQTGFTGLLR
jgi:hypothetical protein